MRRLLAAFLISALLGGCATNSPGSNWALADFNKYGLYYDDFPINRLSVGMPRSELINIFGTHLRTVEASRTGEILTVDRWASVAGPDYIAERLVLNVQGNKLVSWRIEKATVKIVANSW